MKTNKILKTILVITVLSLSVYYGLTLNKVNIANKDEIIETSGNGFGQSLGIVLIIENERDGEIIYRMEKDDDLALRNLAGFTHYMIKGSEDEISNSYRITTGASVPIDLDDSSHNILCLKATMYVGIGTTAPTYEDWKLETETYEDYTEAIGYSVNGLQMNATYVTTFNIDDTYAITEAGFSINFYYNAVYMDFLVFRDVFSAINVVSGDLLTVKYVVMFN